MMALFRAYADEASLSSTTVDQVVEIKDDDKDSDIEIVDEAKENEMLESDKSETDKSEDSKSADRETPEKVKEPRKKRKRESKNCDRTERANVEDANEDFFTDIKRDRGNMGVSTLYKPARPRYDYINLTIGGFYPCEKRRKRHRPDRYFDLNLLPSDDKDEDGGKRKRVVKYRKKKSRDSEYIEIGDSGLRWDEAKVETDLLEKTSQFNKYLNNNPYDINMWLDFVKFQEDYVTFNVLNNRVASEATARNLCYSKQLAILDNAIKKNFNSIELLAKKVELSRQTLPNDQYLNMLKGLVSAPELQKNLLTRVWFWYIDGVQCSMALCSVPSIKEMYAAAIKALSKKQLSNYNISHIDIVYRLGMFLRQSGLYEQFWMFFKMTMQMNFIISDSMDFSRIEDLFVLDEEAITSKENEIINSGLPSHSVWSRIELMRSHFCWLPSKNECDDPQRVVFTTDFSDFIKPITERTDVFHIVVNFIRSLKVPLLPIRQSVPIFASKCPVEWEYDYSELFLSFIHSAVPSNKFEDSQVKAVCNIIKDLADEPNYLSINGDFFKFVSNIMVHCAKWFGGSEKTALYIWWLRLQRVLLIITQLTDEKNFKSAASSIRKSVKDVLKSEKDNIILFTEFAKLEAQVFGVQRSVEIMEMSFRNIGNVNNINRINLARSLVEKLLMDENNKTENVKKCVHILIALASEKNLVTDTSRKFSNDEVRDAVKLFSEKSDSLLTNISSCTREMDLVDCMLPDETVDWICCHGWLVYLAQPRECFLNLYRELINALDTEQNDKSPESKKRRWLKENLIEWLFLLLKFNKNLLNTCDVDDELNYSKILDMSLKDYSLNSCVVWNCIFLHMKCGPVGRIQFVKALKNSAVPSQLLAIAILLDNFVLLYQNNDPLFENIWQPSHENRLLNMFHTIMHIPHMTKCALIWKLYLVFLSHHTNQPFNTTKKILYQALDECPWNKDLYRLGCIYIPAEFSEIIDLMVEKQIRLHTMPEELQPL